MPTYLHSYIPTYLHAYIPAYLQTKIDDDQETPPFSPQGRGETPLFPQAKAPIGTATAGASGV